MLVVDAGGDETTARPTGAVVMWLNSPVEPTNARHGDLWLEGWTWQSILFRPALLFANNEQGAWYGPSDLSTLFQDDAGSTPVTSPGQTVGRVNDRSGNDNHATQATSAARPQYREDGPNPALRFDGVDDGLNITVPAGGWTGTLYYAGAHGRGAFRVAYPAGVRSLGVQGDGRWNDDIFVLLVRDGAISSGDEAELNSFYSFAGPVDWGSLTNGA